MQCVFTQDWLNSFWIAVSCSVLPFISYGKQSDECTWRIMSLLSINVNKLLIRFFILHFVVACLLFNIFFLYWCCCCLFTPLFLFIILLLLLYFYLYVDHVNNPIIFVYHFENNISIIVTIRKVFLRRFPLSRFLAKTLRVNKNCYEKFL